MTPSRSAPSGRSAYNERAREARRLVGGVKAAVRAWDVSDGHRRLFTHHQAPISGAGGLAARRATDDCHSPVVLTRQRRAGLTHTYDAATSATISAPGRSDNELPPTDRQTASHLISRAATVTHRHRWGYAHSDLRISSTAAIFDLAGRCCN